MSDKVKREKEEEYFLKKEMDLRQKLKERMQSEAKLARLKGEFGEADERVLEAFEQAGFSRDTVVVLHLIPLIEVAWADGSVSEAEKKSVLEVARLRDIQPGTPAHDLLEKGLRQRPSPEVFDACRRAIRLIFESLPEDKKTDIENTLSSAIRNVAAASGGILGFGNRVSAAEAEAIDRVVKMFEQAHAKAAKTVADQL